MWNIFYPASIKDYNGAAAMRTFCAPQIEPTTPSIKIRMTKLNRRLAELCKYVLVFTFDWIEGVLRYTKQEP